MARYKTARLAAGLLLAIGAIAKISGHLSSSPNQPDNGKLDLTLAALELCLCGLLVFGIKPKLTWKLTLVTFCGFACYSTLAILEERTSCGCFGALSIQPELTLLLDLIVIILLLTNPPATDCIAQPLPQDKLAFYVVPVCITAIALLFSIALVARLFSYSKTEAFEPNKWIGQPLPFLNEIKIEERLDKGNRLVLFYRPDCEHCMRILSTYELALQRLGTRPTSCQLALIDVSKSRPTEELSTMISLGIDASHGILSEWSNWIISTPLEVYLDDGRLTSHNAFSTSSHGL